MKKLIVLLLIICISSRADAVQETRKPPVPLRPASLVEARRPPVPSRAGVEKYKAVRKILIKKIVVEGHQILPGEEIRLLVKKYENRMLSTEEISSIANEITELYKSYGIMTALAYLPPQEVENNTLKINIIEGRIGNIKVEGNRHTWDFYLRNVLKQNEGDIIFVPEIEQNIINFNKNNDIKLRATVKKGENLGESDIILHVEEKQPFHLGASFDNTGIRSTGNLKTGTTLTIDSLLGFRDRLVGNYSFANGVNSVFSVYDFPIGYGGTRVGGLFSYGDSQVKQGLYKDLKIEAKTLEIGTFLNQPIFNNNKYIVYSTLGFNARKTETYLLDELAFEPTQVRVGNIGLTAIATDKYGQWVHNSTANLGMNILGGQEKFFKYNASLQRIQFIGKKCLLLIKGAAQFTTDDIPAIEQFSVGGYSTVRGYPESYSLGDNGFSFNAEFRFPLFIDRLQGLVFADMGSSIYRSRDRGTDLTLVSVGGGLRFNFTKYLWGRADYGFGLSDKTSEVPFAKLHFSLESTPF